MGHAPRKKTVIDPSLSWTISHASILKRKPRTVANPVEIKGYRRHGSGPEYGRPPPFFGDGHRHLAGQPLAHGNTAQGHNKTAVGSTLKAVIIFLHGIGAAFLCHEVQTVRGSPTKQRRREHAENKTTRASRTHSEETARISSM